MSDAVLEIGGMTCGHCRERVEKALAALPGVRSVEVDLEGERARVRRTGDEPDERVLVQAVHDAGYRARPA